MHKILWVVNYNDVQAFARAARHMGATGVAIRTDNNLAQALDVFHGIGMQVFGWRWPSAQHDSAMREADKVASAFHAGLDGYFADPEGAPGYPWDWDRSGLEVVAEQFCAAITAAAQGKPFGVTSHFRAKEIFPHLPWATFFRHADVFLPQAYWRVAGGPVGKGIPSENYGKAISAWSAAGATPSRIVPMAGEIALAQPAEIADYGKAALRHRVKDLHFYAHRPQVSGAVWEAIAAL
jgi:hypothetical protein